MRAIGSPLVRPWTGSALGVLLAVWACAPTSLPVQRETRGQNVPWRALVSSVRVQATGPIRLRKVVSADWSVPRSGLIHLKHPKAVAAGLQDGDEPIQIYFYVLEHPLHGAFLVDTGMGAVFRQESSRWPVSGIIRSFMKMDTLKIHITLAEWLKAEQKAAAGVFLTHLHLDHILGTADVPTATPVFVGPREATARAPQNSVVQGSTDRLLGAGRTLTELAFGAAGTQGLAALDFFGDGSLFVLHVPGHTPGSLAFVVRALDGRHLLLGDTCHTRWGWQNNVPPGTFTADQGQNALGLQVLKTLSADIAPLTVHPGHQSL